MQATFALHHHTDSADTRAAVAAVAAVPHVLSNPTFRPAATTPDVVEAVSALIEAGWGTGGAPPETYPELTLQLQQLLEALLHEQTLAQHAVPVVQHLVPALCMVRSCKLPACQLVLLKMSRMRNRSERPTLTLKIPFVLPVLCVLHMSQTQTVSMTLRDVCDNLKA
jgi:hypothetical protein